MRKEYTFTVHATGRITIPIVADSYEEAIRQANEKETFEDIDLGEAELVRTEIVDWSVDCVSAD